MQLAYMCPKLYHEVKKKDRSRVISTADESAVGIALGFCAQTVTTFAPSMLQATWAISVTKASRVKYDVLSMALEEQVSKNEKTEQQTVRERNRPPLKSHEFPSKQTGSNQSHKMSN